jgi:ATP-binding protein involved in chromosome partitioning
MGLTEQDILSKLSTIPIPSGSRDLVSAGTVRQLEVEGDRVRVLLAVEASRPGIADTLRGEVERQLNALPGVAAAEVKVQTLLATVQGPAPSQAAPQPQGWAHLIPGVERVIAVASGKGGVGKSTVAANLALALARQGHTVGLLDADIYGPSQQLMMGAVEGPTGDDAGKIHPVEAPGGVKVMSFGYIVDADQPVIWRGPMLQKALEQVVGDVLGGELDYLWSICPAPRRRPHPVPERAARGRGHRHHSPGRGPDRRPQEPAHVPQARGSGARDHREHVALHLPGVRPHRARVRIGRRPPDRGGAWGALPR